MPSFARLFGTILLLAIARIVSTAPAYDERSTLDLAKRQAIPSAPRFVVYSDEWVSGENGPPSASTVKVSVSSSWNCISF